MASVYTNDLRLEEIGSGEQSGTWGDTTNTNLELIAEAFSFGEETITTNANTHPTTIANGASDPGRSIFLKYGGALDSACTITLGPNTVSKLWFIHNATTDNSADNSGPFSILIAQGDGNTKVTIPPGHVKAVYTDGAGSSAIVVDAFAALSVVDLLVDDDLTVTDDVSIGGTLTVTGDTTFNGDLTVTADTVTFTSANANDPALKLINTTNDTDGAELQIRKDKGAAGADGDIVGLISFIGDDAAQQQHIFAKMTASIATAADGSEGGKLAFGVASHDAEFQNGLVLQDGNAEDEIDVTIASGTSSLTSVAGNLGVTGNAGIGTSSPTFSAGGGLNVLNSSFATIRARGGSSTGVDFAQTSGGVAYLYNRDNASLILGTNNDDRLIIAADGAVSTPTAGTSNVRLGVNAGDSIVSGANYNVAIGDEAGTSLTNGALNNVLVGYQAGTLVAGGDNNVLLGYQAGDAITSASNNIAIGKNALGAEDTHDFNIAIGSNALAVQNAGTDGHNVAIGYNAGLAVIDGVRNTIVGSLAGLQATTIDDCVIIGYEAGGGAAMTGHDNVFIGKDSGKAMTSGQQNVFIGRDSGTLTDTGHSNVGVGHDALTNNVDGDGAVAVGFEALQNLEPADGQSYNVAIGYRAGKGVSTGHSNTMIGGLTCAGTLTGTGNVAIGTEAGNDLTSGSSNTFIGVQTGDAMLVGIENVAIGHNALGADDNGSECVAIGAYALDAQNADGSGPNAFENTAIGHHAGTTIVNGYYNTLVGGNAGDTINSGLANICIGRGSDTSADDTDNAICIGIDITAAGNDFSFGKDSNVVTNDFDTDNAWSRSSDVRLKKNIANQTLGLDFINDLRTVKYNWKPNNELDSSDSQLAHLRKDEEGRKEDHEDFDGTIFNHMNTTATMHNFIAQEVKAALDTAGVSDFGGWKEDHYGVQQVSREMFVIPLVKAVQELSTALDAALARIATLEG